MKKLLIISFLFGITMPLNSNINIFAVPGQNGLGSSKEYVQNLLNLENANIIPVKTPTGFFEIDLGQSGCLKYLECAFIQNQKSAKTIIHATSQGTATTLNYLAENSNCADLVILEAVLLSGTSAIYHTLKSSGINISILDKMFYVLPYLAKTQFPGYSPIGKQAVKNIKKINRKVPIVIVHSQHDMQLSFDDACALYYALKENGNDVYLIEKKGKRHLEILQSKEDQDIIQNILNVHGFISKIETEVDLKHFQPQHTQFKKLYNNLCSQEKKLSYFSFFGKIAAFAILMKLTNGF